MIVEETNIKLNLIGTKISSGRPLKIAILGLGSVGSYLLDYLATWPEKEIEIHVCGRSCTKLEPTVNIIQVANAIRHDCSKKIYCHAVDLDHVEAVSEFLEKVAPDFIVNTSRVYSGLKYGTISWKNLRAYGIWTPLSIKLIRNIMIAYGQSSCRGIVINTSYSDVVNPWLKSAGIPCPDFGSGNLNHLIPRIKLAISNQLNIENIGELQVALATSHFHDVVISKEGHTEGVDPLLHVSHNGKALTVDAAAVYRACAIPMPTDTMRNMMNASSNFEIIRKIISAIRENSAQIIHSPGVDGRLGGYPVKIDFGSASTPASRIGFLEDFFSLDQMEAHNRKSIALDGIEDVSTGNLVYTDALREKVKKAFGVSIPKTVPFEMIEEVANLLIDSIIMPASARS